MALDWRYKLVFHSIFAISLPIFFKLCMKRSSFKMIFFALKISRGWVCCMPAALIWQDIRPHFQDVSTWIITLDRRQSKTLILSTNVVKKSLVTNENQKHWYIFWSMFANVKCFRLPSIRYDNGCYTYIYAKSVCEHGPLRLVLSWHSLCVVVKLLLTGATHIMQHMDFCLWRM